MPLTVIKSPRDILVLTILSLIYCSCRALQCMLLLCQACVLCGCMLSVILASFLAIIFSEVHNHQVAWWRNGEDVGLAINRSRIQILPRAMLRNNLGQVVQTYVPVTKQYNLVLAKGRWCCATGGPLESNGSLPLGAWLMVTCGLTACTLGSSLSPTLGTEYGKPLPLPFYITTMQ